LFARHQVREYWLVDPDAPAIEVYTLSGGNFELAGAARSEETLRSPLLTDLELRPGDLVPETPQ